MLYDLSLSISSCCLSWFWYHLVPPQCAWNWNKSSESLQERRKATGRQLFVSCFSLPGWSCLFQNCPFCHDSHCPMTISHSAQRSLGGLPIEMSIKYGPILPHLKCHSPKIVMAICSHIPEGSPKACSHLGFASCSFSPECSSCRCSHCCLGEASATVTGVVAAHNSMLWSVFPSVHVTCWNHLYFSWWTGASKARDLICLSHHCIHSTQCLAYNRCSVKISK